MKGMILLVLALVGVVAVLAFCPAVRTRAEAALFTRDEPQQAASRPAAGRQSSGSDRLVMADRLRGTAESAASAKSGIAELALPVAAPRPTAPAARQSEQRIALPPGLARVHFGMSRAQIEGMYATGWTKQQGGELTLVHYPDPDKMQMVRFVLVQDSLSRIEVRFKASPGETVRDVCRRFEERYATMYPNVAESSRSRWSDGVLALEVKNVTTAAEVRYTALPRKG